MHRRLHETVLSFIMLQMQIDREIGAGGSAVNFNSVSSGFQYVLRQVHITLGYNFF